MEYCVYKHTAPDGKVYIGITSKNPSKRWDYGRGYKHNAYFTNAILKYGWNRFDHEILYDGLSRKEAEEMERNLIAEYHSNDPLYGFNLTNGGESGKRHSPLSIEKMSVAKRGKYDGEKNPRFGVHCSDETKQKISKSLKGKLSGDKNPNYGKPMSAEQKKLISDARTGKHYPKLSDAMKASEACANVHKKQKIPIVQYTKSGEFVRVWDSAADASVGLLGHRRGQSNICSCVTGNLSSAYGYIWKYYNVDNEGGGRF